MTTSHPAPDPAADPAPEASAGPDSRRADPAVPARSGRPHPGWTEIGVAVAAYLVASVLLVLGAGLLVGGPGVAAALLTAAVSGVAALLASGAAVAVRVRSWAAVGVRSTTVRWLALGLLAGLLSWGLARVVILGFVALSGDTSNPQASLLPAIGGSLPALLGLLALGAVLVPVGEEILFRGVLATALGRYGAAVAVVVSALVFALAHGPNVVGLAVVPLGVLNAVMLRRSGSVWPGVVAHGVNNALVFGIGALVL